MFVKLHTCMKATLRMSMRVLLIDVFICCMNSLVFFFKFIKAILSLDMLKINSNTESWSFDSSTAKLLLNVQSSMQNFTFKWNLNAHTRSCKNIIIIQDTALRSKIKTWKYSHVESFLCACLLPLEASLIVVVFWVKGMKMSVCSQLVTFRCKFMIQKMFFFHYILPIRKGRNYIFDPFQRHSILA